VILKNAIILANLLVLVFKKTIPRLQKASREIVKNLYIIYCSIHRIDIAFIRQPFPSVTAGLLLKL